jgi:hypothetical protein
LKPKGLPTWAALFSLSLSLSFRRCAAARLCREFEFELEFSPLRG